MRKEIKYKRQGDGRDSWEVREFDNNNKMLNAYMVYEDPNIEEKTDVSKIDPNDFSADQIQKLKIKLGLK